MDFPKQILSACCLPGYGLNKDGNVLVQHSGKSTMDPATDEQSSKKEPILGGLAARRGKEEGNGEPGEWSRRFLGSRGASDMAEEGKGES